MQPSIGKAYLETRSIARFGEAGMSFNLTNLTLAQIGWIALALFLVVVVFVVVRFFFHHILKYLIQGCAFLLLVVIALALLHYFRVF
jgi:hypothetical protein